MKSITYIGDNRLQYLKDCSNKGLYEQAKWIQFIQVCMELGLRVGLKKSKSTVSKYIYVNQGAHTIKVRFSNHRPAKRNDADIYVGQTWDGKFYPTWAAVNYLIKAFNLNEPYLKAMPTPEW